MRYSSKEIILDRVMHMSLSALCMVLTVLTVIIVLVSRLHTRRVSSFMQSRNSVYKKAPIRIFLCTDP